MVGNIKPIMEINIAICCDCAAVEIKIPSDKLAPIKRKHSNRINAILPLIGKSRSVTERMSMVSTLVNPIIK